jgi:hypothetical protein
MKYILQVPYLAGLTSDDDLPTIDRAKDEGIVLVFWMK